MHGVMCRVCGEYVKISERCLQSERSLLAGDYEYEKKA